MNLEQLSYLAEVVGVIAVVATLIYLARQVSQGNALTRMQSRESMMNQDLLTLQLQLADNDISRAFYKERPDEDDWLKMNLLLTLFLRQREWEWLLHKDGVFPKDVYETYVHVIPSFLGTERTQLWWNSIGRTSVTPEFAQEVDRLIAEQPETDYWSSWRNFLKKAVDGQE